MSIPPSKALSLFFILFLFSPYQEKPPPPSYPADDSLAEAKMRNLYQFMLNMKSSELERRKEARRVLQRQGYARMLTDVVNNDGLSALLSYLKVKLQIDYAHSTEPPIYLMRGDPRFGVRDLVISEDWSFPTDPWKRE